MTTPHSAVPGSLTFDVREIPFSCRGSWLNLSPVVALDTQTDTIHLVSHKNGMHGVLALQPQFAGEPVATEWHAEAASLTWSPTGGVLIGATIEAAFDRTEAVRLRGNGLELCLTDAAGGLTPFTGSYLFTDPVDGAAVFTSYETGRRYRVTSMTGSIDVVGHGALGVADRAVVLGGDGTPWEAADPGNHDCGRSLPQRSELRRRRRDHEHRVRHLPRSSCALAECGHASSGHGGLRPVVSHGRPRRAHLA